MNKCLLAAPEDAQRNFRRINLTVTEKLRGQANFSYVALIPKPISSSDSDSSLTSTFAGLTSCGASVLLDAAAAGAEETTAPDDGMEDNFVDPSAISCGISLPDIEDNSYKVNL
ncbi:hypothetical protein MS3_00005667 [Schistosoma haematobium]|uniref:Uncharacterized protein n=1 Tax=Schistosoma haematobium TaxID=6185 RepID=A0A094ZNG7_SCHHA|nr:hypothetical protein MS3_00005667 [Schistosoma haematobium]KAH9588194.1 hypothetical protein MS3_00005667 [Schistosoma haematobium]